MTKILSSVTCIVCLITFIGLSDAAPEKGDVNGDGKVRSNDALLALRIVVGLLQPTEAQKEAADMDNDGKIKSNDAFLILQKAVGLEAGPALEILSAQAISIPKIEAEAGSLVEAPINIDGEVKNVGSIDVTLTCDAKLLTAKEVVSIVAGFTVLSNVGEAGKVIIGAFSADGLGKTIAAGAMFKVKFEVNTDAKGGDKSNLTLEEMVLSGANGKREETALEVENGEFMVSSDEANRALSLDGNGDYVEVPDNVSLDITNQITIEAWIQPRVTSGKYVVVKRRPSGGGNVYTLDIYPGKIRTILYGVGDITGNTLIEADSWQHIAMTWDGSEIKVYLNGIADGNTMASGTIEESDGNVEIGRYSGGVPIPHFNGFIDEVRIWNIARTQEQIQDAMNRTLTDDEIQSENLVGYWRFDDGTANDSSLYGNHGTLLGDAEIIPLVGTWPPPLRGDVSGNGTISAYDASLILQYVVGLIDEFPADLMVSPSAIEAHDYEVSLTNVETSAGKKIQVPIAINDAKGLLAGGITIKYDSTVLRSTDVLCGGILSQSYWRKNTDFDDEVRFAFASAKGATGSGRMLVIEFEVLPNTEGKTSDLILDNINLSNSLTITKINGSVTVIPSTFALLQNYPNPFNPDTWLPFKLAQNALVSINIYDTKGQLIRTIALGNKNAGVYVTKESAAYWDGRDNLGDKVSSGVYFYTLQAGEFRATRKMVIVK